MTDMLPDIRLAADYYAIRLERYKVETRIAQTKNTFVLTGYIAAEDAEKLKKELEDQFDIQIDTCEPDAEEEAPVAIKNNAFAAPVESVIEAYSYPSKGEIDPTAVTAVFYYILFGMMLGDAGYGILMVLVCGALLLKFRNMETGMKRTLGMFFYSGISTIFWGVMFGSFFGDAFTVISTTFFKNPIVFKPILMDPLSNAMSTLLFCLSVGIVHIYTGLIMKLIVLFKQKQYIEALYDVISWMVLVGGLLIILISSAMFGDIAGSTIPMPNFVLTVSKVGALLSSVVILLTSGRSSRNWFKRLLKGAYGLYNITGYLSDILSYSRLLALGLATSAIGSVINKMGAMFGDGIIGLIGFSIVFIIGHLLNMAINLLGAYVHTNRLQFVEFFGKFYEGGGRKFEPFAVNSKYYNFAEETK